MHTLLFGNCSNRCLVCGAEVFDHSGLCSSCNSLMPHNNGKTCIRCGCSIDGQEDYCDNCSFGNRYFDKAYSLYIYQDNVTSIIRSIKFGGRADRTLPLAYQLTDLATRHNIPYDIVCNVPMTADSYKKRGYNQSQLLSQYYCDIIGGSYCDALVKVRTTVPQEQLTRSQRRDNVVRAFVADKDKVAGKKILLIDDVMTTGATLDNCARALKKAGAISVYCISVASGKIKLAMEDKDGSIY